MHLREAIHTLNLCPRRDWGLTHSDLYTMPSNTGAEDVLSEAEAQLRIWNGHLQRATNQDEFWEIMQHIDYWLLLIYLVERYITEGNLKVCGRRSPVHTPIALGDWIDSLVPTTKPHPALASV